MAHFVGIKSDISGWVAGTPITQGNMWQIDSNLAKAVNGDDGGVWSPTSAITIGGSGLTVDGAVFTITASGSIACAGAANFTGNVTLGNASGDTLNFNGTEYHAYAETHNGLVTFSGETLFGAAETHSGSVTFNGNVQVGNAGSDTLTVTSASTFNGTVTHNGAVTIGAGTGSLTVNGSLAVNYGATFAGATSILGHITPTDWIGDTSVVLSAISYARYVFDGITATRSLTIQAGVNTFTDGYTVIVNNTSATHSLNVYYDTTLLGVVGGSTQGPRRELVMHSGTWVLL